MKLKDLRISKQLALYFGAIFIIVAGLIANSYITLGTLWGNTYGLYNHPLAVRRAIGELETSVLLIHRDMRQLPFTENKAEVEGLISNIESNEDTIQRQLDIVYERYLGPRNDIEEVSEALAKWKSIRNETVRLFHAGELDEVADRVKSTGVGGAQADEVMRHLSDISKFAMDKADSFYQTAQAHRIRIMIQMGFLCLVVFILLVLIGMYLRKGILPPLVELTRATEAINQGRLDTRIRSTSVNELGDLSRAFDNMADTIEREIGNREKAARISSVMFKHGTLRPFCQELLKSLLEMTDSQLGAMYFMDETATRLVQYESIGMKHGHTASFSVVGKEGEFGVVLSSKKIHHITTIPEDVELVFPTTGGEFKAREIITIPILNKDDIVAVVSLASVKLYTPDVIQLATGLANEITASLNSVLASQKVLEYSQKLQDTNAELHQQARELELQADELSQQNAELEMQKNRLDEASRLKTNFLSNMSHELRTPLNSVIALSGVLSRRLNGKIPAEEQGFLGIIERNGKNLLAMINDILDISRIEAGREEVEISKFNPNDTVAGVLEMLQPQALQQRIELIHQERDAVITIDTDESKFRHIMQNLLGNAVKFTEGGSVEVICSQTDGLLSVSVEDTGIGIPEEILPYIFDEFRQADGSTSRRFGGTGLGLSIAKKYANLLGGDITVKSTPEVGSVFTLTLPMQSCAGISLPGRTESQTKCNDINRPLPCEIMDLSGKTILLVEDNESAIIQIKDLIEELGCTVNVAHDATEAFAIIEKAVPEAMILDLMMPGKDGFRILEILRNAEPTAHIPVLILTAKHITKEELKFLKRNNVHQLIQKGDVKRSELQLAVSTMLYPDKHGTVLGSRNRQTLVGMPVVLVVEDNMDNLITVQALLKEHYSVLTASNAQEGIEKAKKHVPNLILMDIALPDISGIQAFRTIRNMPRTQHIPVIALTASVMKQDREAILSHGFDAFIGKPINADEFFLVIDGVLYGK